MAKGLFAIITRRGQIFKSVPLNTIEALEDRDADLAERPLREHTLEVAAHVEKQVTYLDEGQLNAALR